MKCEISNIFSAYMYPQYAEEIVNAMNENFSETPDLEGKSVAAEDDGSLKADWMHLRNDAYGVEMYQNVIDDKVLCYRWCPSDGTPGSDTCPIYKTDTIGRKSCDKVFCFSYIKYIFFLYDRLQ